MNGLSREDHLIAARESLEAADASWPDLEAVSARSSLATANFLAAQFAEPAEPAAPAQPTGLPGREALMDADGDLWYLVEGGGGDEWQLKDGSIHGNSSRDGIEGNYGPVRRVRVIDLD